GLRVIRDGVQPEDWVIVKGVQRVKTGAKVNPIKQAMPDAPSSPPERTAQQANGGRGAMQFSRFFIDRPIFATVLALVIVIIGLIALYTLPIAEYPEIVPPTIAVTARYPGASPEVIADTVATPIEQEINGVERMLYMSSQSTSDGQMSLTITFQ